MTGLKQTIDLAGAVGGMGVFTAWLGLGVVTLLWLLTLKGRNPKDGQ